MVPKRALAKTFTQGNGVTCVPESLMTYSRPSGEKPPNPFEKTKSFTDEARSDTPSGRYILTAVSGATGTSTGIRRLI